MLLSLAPMEGITTCFFRKVYSTYYGGIDRYYTPFLANPNLSAKDLLEISPEQNQNLPLVPQILTNRTDTFLAIVNHLVDFGYQEVNLNLGCPSGTVVSKKRGAGMLADYDLLNRFLSDIFEKCPISISIKTRIGISDLSEWDSILPIFEQYPIKELIIHPRLQKELYKGIPHMDVYHKTAESTSLPLCYNGNITSPQDYSSFLKQVPACQHIMIGRGVLGNPYLPNALKGEEFPSSIHQSRQVRDTFFSFHNALLDEYRSYMKGGEQQVLFKMKELWYYMAPFAEIDDKSIKKIRKSKTISEYMSILQPFQ